MAARGTDLSNMLREAMGRKNPLAGRACGFGGVHGDGEGGQ